MIVPPPSPSFTGQAEAPKVRSPANRVDTWGRGGGSPSSRQGGQGATQDVQPGQPAVVSRHPSTRGGSTSSAPSTGSGGGGGVVGFSVQDEDREAIRARDERERDLAVQQRRNMEKGSGKATELPRQQVLRQQPQQRGPQEAHEKRMADGEVEKVRSAHFFIFR